MRSELVTQAAGHVDNRFLLVHVASAITRKFHRRTKDRLPDSINNSLAGIGEEKYILTGSLVMGGLVDQFEQGGGCGMCMDTTGGHSIPCSCTCHNMHTLAAFASLTTGLPYFPPAEDEPTPEERMAVCSALLNVADEVVETA